MANAVVDLELYIRVLDYLSERALSEGESQAWADISHDWATGHGLTGDELAYFGLGITRLGGHPWKGEDWEQLDRRPDLDVLVWTFHRAWTDMHGYLYPPTK